MTTFLELKKLDYYSKEETTSLFGANGFSLLLISNNILLLLSNKSLCYLTLTLAES